jgi:hypothetical protein
MIAHRTILFAAATLAMIAGAADHARAETQEHKECAEALATEFAMVDALVACDPDQSWLNLPRFKQIHTKVQFCHAVLTDDERLPLAFGGTAISKNLQDTIGHKDACATEYRILWLGEKQRESLTHLRRRRRGHRSD